MKLTIGIACYNVQNYIARCLNSIVFQSLADGEIDVLCINDKSTDNTGNILKEYQKKYPFIRIIDSPENRKLPFVRNETIRQAKGDYIWFVDGDDMIETNAIANIRNILADQRPDIMIFNHVRVSEEAAESTFHADITQCETVCDYPRFYGSKEFGRNSGRLVMWGGVFKRDYLQSSNAQVDENLAIGEDTDFILRLPKCEILLTDCVAYLYRVRMGSATLSDDKTLKSYLALKTIYQKHNTTGNTLDDLSHGILTSLLQIKDHDFVKTELTKLKKEGIYPYHFRWSIWQGDISFAKKIILFLMPIYPCFLFTNWIICKCNKSKR